MTPSSVAVLSGLDGSGGNSLMERFVGLLSWFGDTVLGETVGVRPTCPVPNVGASSCFPVPLERTVYPQVGPLDPVVDPPSTFVTVLCSVGTCFSACPGSR